MIVYRELSSLEQDLGIPVKTLYAVSNNLRGHYRKVLLPKKSGDYRKLSVPDEILKKNQRQIADVLLIHMPVSRYAKAYRFGSTTLKNAKPHVRKPIVLKLDILHFFDSIRYIDVKDKTVTMCVSYPLPKKLITQNIGVLSERLFLSENGVIF